jgi:hypothetical protein
MQVGVIYFRSEPENRSLSRRCGFHPRGRIFLRQNFSEPVSRSYFAGRALFVQAHEFGGRSGIGIQQEVASTLPRVLCEISRLWVMLLDQGRERQNRENHGTQNSHCKPLSIAIESSDHVICGG